LLHFDQEVRLFDLVLCLSDAIDLVSRDLVNHHKQTAYIASQISSTLGFDRQRQLDLILAGMIHDVGALPLYDSLDDLNTIPKESIEGHAELGAHLISSFAPLATASEIIKCHHLDWDEDHGEGHLGCPVMLESHLLHLADRIALLLDPTRPPLEQDSRIVEQIRLESPQLFHPELVEAFESCAHTESFWFDLLSPALGSRLRRHSRTTTIELDLKASLEFTNIFSKVIDFRSRFTATHSAGVATSAQHLSRAAGFSPREQQQMLLAGHLHDLGKLAVPRAILEKPGKLTHEEFNVMRSHTYHSFHIIETIPGFETIAAWAAFHHERLDGTGYPFHIREDELTLGSRIMAVADVFTAVTENRPYREAMPLSRAMSILENMVKGRALDSELVHLMDNNLSDIDEARREAQLAAAQAFESFRREFSLGSP
jgi:HD-GYP domain-containing protein (c-di-GMP phosphodiesterase class II)